MDVEMTAHENRVRRDVLLSSPPEDVDGSVAAPRAPNFSKSFGPEDKP